MKALSPVSLFLFLVVPLPAREPPRRVLLVSIDGLRADAVTLELMPRLSSLAARGLATFEAQSQPPTFTIPNHVSLLTGLTPATHGLTAIDDPGDAVADGTILELGHAAGLRTALYISKDKLRLLAKPGTLDRYMVTSTGGSTAVVDAFLADLSRPETRWDLSVVHLIEPDATGHREGWMTVPYKAAVKQADAHVGRLLDGLVESGLEANTLAIVTSDHGGLGFEHSAQDPQVTNVPWIASGTEVPRGGTIARRIGVHDTAPTILRALGLEVPAAMEGIAVEELFSGGKAFFLRGDVDADGSVTLSDVETLLSHLFLGEDAPCTAAGDANADGKLDITDAIGLLGHLFLGRGPPAPPFPACGEGEDPPGLPCAAEACA